MHHGIVFEDQQKAKAFADSLEAQFTENRLPDYDSDMESEIEETYNRIHRQKTTLPDRNLSITSLDLISKIMLGFACSEPNHIFPQGVKAALTKFAYRPIDQLLTERAGISGESLR